MSQPLPADKPQPLPLPADEPQPLLVPLVDHLRTINLPQQGIEYLLKDKGIQMKEI